MIMYESNIETFLHNNGMQLEKIKNSKRGRLFFALNPKISRLYRCYLSSDEARNRNEACARILNTYEESFVCRIIIWKYSMHEDVRVLKQQLGKRRTVDRSGRKKADYYSVVIVLKNEARYIREQILFYLSTGADRIYIYDNDSTDDLLGKLEPFLKEGTVIYRRWPGSTVQTAAYRDAVHRTRNCTKWLAIVDSDEYLFSPKGSMPEQLRAYESYPGVCVNWIVFGPNGHDRRPEGLIMDNYTTAIANHSTPINCHIKSIVQPAEVRTVMHTHFAFYKRGRFAVDETGRAVDNFSAYSFASGRAYTEVNQRETFRINHYLTRSIEDLEAKCNRGYADGAPNAVFDVQLAPFREPLEEDFSIKPYADIVREKITEYE